MPEDKKENKGPIEHTWRNKDLNLSKSGQKRERNHSIFILNLNSLWPTWFLEFCVCFVVVCVLIYLFTLKNKTKLLKQTKKKKLNLKENIHWHIKIKCFIST